MKLLSIPKEAAACRAAFAAQPEATVALHLHHEVFAEPIIEPIEHRITYILILKPKHERALRLRLMRPLPPTYDAAHDAAVAAADAAADAYDAATEAGYAAAVAARDAYDAHAAARAAADGAAYAVATPAAASAAAIADADAYAIAVYAARNAVHAARTAAYDAVIVAAQAVIVNARTQHDTRCVPDCPWDGKTIFSEDV